MDCYSKMMQSCLKVTESNLKTITQEEFNELVEKHKLWLEGKDGGEELRLRDLKLSWLNLSNMNLESAMFYNCIFDRVIMTNTNLSLSKIDNSYMFCCKFTDVYLNFVKWNGIRFYKSEFQNVNISSNIEHSIMQECIFEDSTMDNLSFCDTSLYKSSADELRISNSKFTTCKLSLSKFKHALFNNVTFINSYLTYAEFDNSNLNNVDFQSSNLYNSKFYYCNLDTASLFESILDNASIYNSTLKDKIIQMGPVGSRNSNTLYFVDKDNIRCGCWNNYKGGTLEEFEKAVNQTYPDGEYHDEYMIAIETFKKYRELYLKSKKGDK